MDLMTATPVEFDTALAALWQDFYRAEDTVAGAWRNVVHYANAYLGLGGYRKPDATAQQIRDALIDATETGRSPLLVGAYDKYETAGARRDDIHLRIAEFNDAFRARGGWTRAYLVDNSNGHVHSSMSCSTCFATTRYHWLTEVSDHDEAQIVEMAASRACTVCYPSAPLDKPSVFFTPDEVAADKARQEKEAKRAEKDAAKVTVEGYADSSFSKPKTHVFNTVRGATNAIASDLGSLAWYGTDHPSSAQWLANIDAIRKALADKGVDHDYDKALAAARKKVTREGGTPKF